MRRTARTSLLNTIAQAEGGSRPVAEARRTPPPAGASQPFETSVLLVWCPVCRVMLSALAVICGESIAGQRCTLGRSEPQQQHGKCQNSEQAGKPSLRLRLAVVICLPAPCKQVTRCCCADLVRAHKCWVWRAA